MKSQDQMRLFISDLHLIYSATPVLNKLRLLFVPLFIHKCFFITHADKHTLWLSLTDGAGDNHDDTYRN